MRSITLPAVVGAIALATALHGAHAAGAEGRPMPAPTAPPEDTEADTAPPVVGIGVPLPARSLQSMRGGDSTTTNSVDIRGGVDGNTATDVVSGTNVIQGGSFANASGISTVIQNSGSNVLIQNGTVVNVQFVEPSP